MTQRRQAADAAMASVKVEGLTPTPETVARVERYVDGSISAQQLLEQTLEALRVRSAKR